MVMFCHSPQAPPKGSRRVSGDRSGIPPSFLLGKKHLVRKSAILQRNQNFVVHFSFLAYHTFWEKATHHRIPSQTKRPEAHCASGCLNSIRDTLPQQTGCLGKIASTRTLGCPLRGASFPPLQCTASYGVSRQRFGYCLHFYPPPFSTELYSRIYFRINRTVSTYIKGLIFFSRALPVMRFSSVQEMTPMVIPSEML